jgi:hypothetical protein
VKVLKIQDMPQIMGEFEREIDLLSKLRHKNIGKYCDKDLLSLFLLLFGMIVCYLRNIKKYNFDDLLIFKFFVLKVQFVGASTVIGRLAILTEFMELGSASFVC